MKESTMQRCIVHWDYSDIKNPEHQKTVRAEKDTQGTDSLRVGGQWRPSSSHFYNDNPSP
jgi:hypothetical protein